MRLDRGEAQRALQSREFRQQVLGETQHAQRSGARGVPFALVDGRYTISGAQDADTLLSSLQKTYLSPACLPRDIGRKCREAIAAQRSDTRS
jgi:predicted DsbA family dithiol-disulfide isomerase